MNNTFQFRILFCLFAAFLMTSCEKTDLQKTTSVEEATIESRTECDNCPDGPPAHCCCAIELLDEGAFLNLEFCGTSGSKESTTLCGPEEPATTHCDYTVDGYAWSTILNGNNLKQPFCMAPNTAFMIKVTGGMGPVRITCQDGVTFPQNFFGTLSSVNKYFFDVNDACEVDDCP